MNAASPRAGWALLLRVLLFSVGLAPAWTPLVRDLPVLSTLAVFMEAWFHVQCHQDGARGLWGSVLGLPVCARCAGIYWGLALGALLFRPRLSPRAIRNWVIFASVLMILDVGSERLGWRGAWPHARTLTGMLLAYPVAIATVQSVLRSGAK